MPGSRPSLRVLAAEAGVSAMTVSLALRNRRNVSPTLRLRLQRLALARGYRPDPRVAQLMHHLRTRAPLRSTANICGLFDGPPRARFVAGNYLDRLCRGLRERLESLGYSFSLLSLDDYPSARQLERVLVSRGIEGLLLLPMEREQRDLSRRLAWEGFSTIAVTSTIMAPRFHCVTPNHYDNIRQACQELARAGSRRIGLAMSRKWDLRVRNRWSGGIAWQNAFGGTSPVEPLIGDGPNPNLSAVSLGRWLEREAPDAVIYESADRATLKEMISRLPARRRPKMVAMNWPDPEADCGIDQNTERIGAVAAEALAATLFRGERGVPDVANSTLIDGKWMPRRK